MVAFWLAGGRRVSEAGALDAADPLRSAWVAANAGAGKTHTLASRVTRLLLSGARPERILCLTYTKAAAAEMSSRLFKQLGEWAMLSDSDLQKKIAQIGGPRSDAPALRSARRLFAMALETPGGLKIQTIHSFCQNLLSRFPLEADVTPAFRVLDEQTTRELLNEGRERVLERAADDMAVQRAIDHLVTHTSEGRMQQVLDAALGTDRHKLDRYLGKLGETSLRTSIRRLHGINEDEAPDGIADAFCTQLRSEVARIHEVVEWMKGGSGRDRERAAALLAAVSLESPHHMFARLRDTVLTKKGAPFADFVTRKLATTRPDLMTYIDSLVEHFCAAEERHRLACSSDLAEAALTLIAAIRKEYSRAKRVRGVLDYDDLINETLRLLDKSDAAQWVLYKLDGGIHHVLIDEAQDTSPEQWAIVRKLTEEFFAGGGARDDRTVRTVFAVGDEKQSIFSFQGADPTQFAENRKHFIASARDGGAEVLNVYLPTSRRSLPEILSFVDLVFAHEEAAEGLTSEGHPVKHLAHRRAKVGLVELWPTIPASDAPKPDPWLPVDVPQEDSPVVQLSRKIADQIKEWLDRRVRLPGHKDPVRAKDIMVLLPRREPFANEIIRRLKERGVPVAGADRMQLTEQIAAMDLMALGRFALLPEDDLTLASVLRSPLARVSEDALFGLSYKRKGSLWRVLGERREERLEFAEAHAFLSEMHGLADLKPPFEFFAHALHARGMKKRLLARLGVEAQDAIEEFLSLALTYEAANTPSLEGFLHWIERGGAEVKRDMEKERDEVRVMTVHGAKGLEADIVVLPDTAGLPDSPAVRGHLLYTEEGVMFPVNDDSAPEPVRQAKAKAMEAVLREHRRLLYVALTRAEDRLYICGFETQRGVRNGSWYQHMQRATEAIGAKIERKGESIWCLGEDSAIADAPRTPELDLRATLPVWIHRAPPTEVVRPRLIRPFDAAGMDEPPTLSPIGGEGAKRFARGILVHALLARLPEIPSTERRDRARRFLIARGMTTDEAAALVESTMHVLEHSDFAAAFTPDSKAEVAIVADLPEIGDGVRVNGRIDRIATSGDTVLIVDFKTNRPPPVLEQDVSALYATQMALYRAAAARIFPNRRIACALVWTEGPHLMQLSDAFLDAEIVRIRARLDPEGVRS
jgi:ATP-dependent helicase/nuclease subunit A